MNKLIGTKGCSTPVGYAGRLRPRRNERDEEAQVSPHGKRAPCSGNQHDITYLIDNFFFQQRDELPKVTRFLLSKVKFRSLRILSLLYLNRF
jgi:hypothetical protein